MNTQEKKLIKARVAAGVAFLDSLYPGWDQSIDLKKYKIEDDENCILGQTLGDPEGYKTLVYPEYLGRESDGAVGVLGCMPFGRGTGKENVAEVKALESEWKKVIKARRA